MTTTVRAIPSRSQDPTTRDLMIGERGIGTLRYDSEGRVWRVSLARRVFRNAPLTVTADALGSRTITAAVAEAQRRVDTLTLKPCAGMIECRCPQSTPCPRTR